MRWLVRLLMLGFVVTAHPALSQAPRVGLTVEERAEAQVWIDEHARWNAAHMAAARRLEAIVVALKRHDSNFDAHGIRLRGHRAATAASNRETAALAQARLRADHEEARSAHHHLLADVDALASVMAEKFGTTPP